jgi:hypothetical protein
MLAVPPACLSSTTSAHLPTASPGPSFSTVQVISTRLPARTSPAGAATAVTTKSGAGERVTATGPEVRRLLPVWMNSNGPPVLTVT